MTTEAANPTILADRLKAGRGAAGSHPTLIDCGHFDMRIARDGTWYYRGSPITRKPLVTLFSTVLVRDDDGQYWLATPVERGRIDVDDAPFVAVEMRIKGNGRDQDLEFRTNVDDIVVADAAHPIHVVVDAKTGEPSPYLLVRDGLEALLARTVFYELVELGVDGTGEHANLFGVWSSGSFFALGDGVDD